MRSGDLAVIVNSHAGNDGTVVRCKKRLEKGPWKTPDGQQMVEAGWTIWPSIAGFDGAGSDQVPDSQLLPLSGLSMVLGVK